MTHPEGSKSPALVQMLQLITNPVGYMEAAAQRYGDIFTAQLGWDFSPHVFVSNPQAIQQICTSESKQFYPFSESLNNFSKPLFGEHSILAVEGARYQRQRQLLMPPFHGERMRAYGLL